MKFEKSIYIYVHEEGERKKIDDTGQLRHCLGKAQNKDNQLSR